MIPPYVHVVKYYECDPMGVTHHSNYVRFMEEARIHMLDELGYGFDKMEAEGTVSPVIGVELEYKKTTRFKDEIEIQVKLKEMSTLKVSFSYVMKVKGVLVARASSTHCFLTLDGKPFSFQERWPELCEKLREL